LKAKRAVVCEKEKKDARHEWHLFPAGGETEDWKVDLEKKVITRRNPKGEPMFKPVFLEVTK